MLFTGNQISAREITRILIIKIVTIRLPIYIPDYRAIKNFSNFLLLRVTQVNYLIVGFGETKRLNTDFPLYVLCIH